MLFRLSAEEIWSYEYNPWNVDGYIGEDVLKCDDGGYVFNGSAYTWDPENPGVYSSIFGYTLKADNLGQIEWIKKDTVSWMSTSKATGLAYASDGSVISAVTPEMAGQCAIIKRDSQGNREWVINPEFAPHSLVACDDGFVAAGYEQAGTDNLKKFNLNGELVWSKDLRASQLNSVVQSSDGGFLTAGIYFGNTDGSLVAVKTNAYGDSIWTRYYDSEYGMDESKGIIETSDNEIIVGGHLDWSPGVLWKLDQEGNTLNIEEINDEIGWAIWNLQEYQNNEIITWGSGPDRTSRFNRYDSNFDFIDSMFGLCSQGDKGFLIDDEYFIYSGYPNITLSKVLYEGVGTDDNLINSPNNKILVSNYPNPFNSNNSRNSTTTIKYYLPKNGNVAISIYNINGISR